MLAQQLKKLESYVRKRAAVSSGTASTVANKRKSRGEMMKKNKKIY
ncbi:hypothetical protein [Flavobacterium gelatinilyticum]|nr:hypothetical protein [Flavobacterium gelatinilyticum]